MGGWRKKTMSIDLYGTECLILLDSNSSSKENTQ